MTYTCCSRGGQVTKKSPLEVDVAVGAIAATTGRRLPDSPSQKMLASWDCTGDRLVMRSRGAMLLLL
jgi:hypothetical protein